METKTLRDVMHEFERLSPLQRDYSPETVRGYMGWLHKLSDWLGHDVPLSDFSAERLRAYRNHILLEKNYRPRSRATMFTALRSFGSWLVDESLLDTNPAVVLGRVKLDDPDRRVVTEDEARRMLAACDRIFHPRRRALAHAVLAVLTYAGLRRSELLALYLTDFQPDPMRPGSFKLLVREGKGGLSREVPICDEAAQAIQNWLPLRAANPRPFLFCQNISGTLSECGLTALLKQICHMAGCDYANPHAHRHGLITRLLLQKEDLKTVSEIAGHKNTSTTINVYYHTTDTRKRDVADRAALAPVPAPKDDKPEPLRIVDFDETA